MRELKEEKVRQAQRIAELEHEVRELRLKLDEGGSSDPQNGGWGNAERL